MFLNSIIWYSPSQLTGCVGVSVGPVERQLSTDRMEKAAAMAWSPTDDIDLMTLFRRCPAVSGCQVAYEFTARLRRIGDHSLCHAAPTQPSPAVVWQPVPTVRASRRRLRPVPEQCVGGGLLLITVASDTT